MLGPAPSASGEPSTWYAEVALPQRNLSGNVKAGFKSVSSRSGSDSPQKHLHRNVGERRQCIKKFQIFFDNDVAREQRRNQTARRQVWKQTVVKITDASRRKHERNNLRSSSKGVRQRPCRREK